MVNPAQKLKRVADLGAAAKAIERDVKAFQQARQTFVTSVRVRARRSALTRECSALEYLQPHARGGAGAA